MYIDKLGLYAVRSHLQILVMSVQVNASEPKGGALGHLSRLNSAGIPIS